jgi:glycosyltransferase involved in cell wall biosynthesis
MENRFNRIDLYLFMIVVENYFLNIFFILNMSPLVSVILPVYNQEKYIVETIEGILNQSFQNFELVILDDGSTDQSARIIRLFAAKDTRIRAFFKSNSGKSNATNYLVSKAKGEWCAFLDADDVMLPERLERQVAFHQANPSIDASSSNCCYINENGNLFGKQRYPGLETIPHYKKSIRNGQFITCSFTGLMVSKSAFLETGGLITKFEPCEDYEFLNRFADKGFVVLVIPEVLMKYRIHPNAITVREPILVRDTISFVKHSITLRRGGKPEISFEEFLIVQNGYSWWKRIDRKRFNYSIIFFRSAGFAILSKKYFSFAWNITSSLVLSPNYVLKKLKNHLRR